MGRDFPPLYKLSDIMQDIEEISKIDEQINELAIKREEYVKTLKQKVKEMANIQVKD